MANTLIRIKCPECGKVAREESREDLHRLKVDDDFETNPLLHEPGDVYHDRKFIDEVYAVQINLVCGHTTVKPIEKADETVEIVSSDGRVPFDFQWETTEFIEKAGLEGLILHEQGLGKTVCGCMIIKRNEDHVLPLLYVCKSGLRAQVQSEVQRWTGMVAEIIFSSRQIPLLDIFPITIVSIDTLRLVRPDLGATVDEIDSRNMTARQKAIRDAKKKPIWSDELLGQYKMIIMDESQKIKNPGSSRTQAFRYFVKKGNEGNKAKVLCMSGTNIEKHAGEYFVTLNAVRPELFPSEHEYQYKWCQVDPDTGKIGGLRQPERFKALTEDFIIRFKRSEVLPQLPKVFRTFRKARIEDNDIIKEYRKVLTEFMEYMDEENKKKTPTDILGYLSRMRHITGVAKVPAALDYIEEFLLENDEDDRKLTVFIHHKKAGAILMSKLQQLCKDGGYNPPLYLTSDLDLQGRTKCVEDFKKPGNRIMVASTLAAGEGLNLQFCSDCLIMERQWNPSWEEQAEGRFPRPGSEASKITAVYLIAISTIDDFLTKIVEEKRRNVAATLDGGEIEWHGGLLDYGVGKQFVEGWFVSLEAVRYRIS